MAFSDTSLTSSDQNGGQFNASDVMFFNGDFNVNDPAWMEAYLQQLESDTRGIQPHFTSSEADAHLEILAKIKSELNEMQSETGLTYDVGKEQHCSEQQCTPRAVNYSCSSTIKTEVDDDFPDVGDRLGAETFFTDEAQAAFTYLQSEHVDMACQDLKSEFKFDDSREKKFLLRRQGHCTSVDARVLLRQGVPTCPSSYVLQPGATNTYDTLFQQADVYDISDGESSSSEMNVEGVSRSFSDSSRQERSRSCSIALRRSSRPDDERRRRRRESNRRAAEKYRVKQKNEIENTIAVHQRVTQQNTALRREVAALLAEKKKLEKEVAYHNLLCNSQIEL